MTMGCTIVEEYSQHTLSGRETGLADLKSRFVFTYPDHVLTLDSVLMKHYPSLVSCHNICEAFWSSEANIESIALATNTLCCFWSYVSKWGTHLAQTFLHFNTSWRILLTGEIKSWVTVLSSNSVVLASSARIFFTCSAFCSFTTVTGRPACCLSPNLHSLYIGLK